MATRPKFSVTLFEAQESHYLSYLNAAMAELEAAGTIELRFTRPPAALLSLRQIPYAQAWFEVTSAGSENRVRVFADLIDAPDINTQALLETDVYLKRSFCRSIVASLPEEARMRVRPLGVHFPCTSAHESGYARLRANVMTGAPPRRLAAAALRTPLAALHAPVRRNPPTLDELEYAPDHPAEARVYFRTRLIDPASTTDAAVVDQINRLNETRLEVIRELKRALGSRFVGGLYPTPYTSRRAPEWIHELPAGLSRQIGHLTFSRRFLINVNTAGVHRSTGWKLPEGLAASRCMLSEAPVYQSRDPLVDGEHYLAFTDARSCVAQCEALLANPGRAHALRKRAYRFFRDRLTPHRAMAATLEDITTLQAAPNAA